MKGSVLKGVFCGMLCAAMLVTPVNTTKAATVAKSAITTMSTEETINLPIISKQGDSTETTSINMAFSDGVDGAQKITLKKRAYFNLSAYCVFDADTASKTASVYIENAAGETVKELYFINSNEQDNANVILEAGTYTIRVASVYKSSGKFFGEMLATNAQITDSISLGKQYIGYSNYEYQYRKFTVSANQQVGVVYFTQSTSGLISGGNIVLLDKNKKPISKSEYTTSTTNYGTSYGLAKGTYYLQIKGSDFYSLQVYTVKAANACATSKKKAKKVTSSTKYYVLPANNRKKTAYFKINVKKAKKQTLEIKYLASSNTYVRVTTYKGSKQVGYSMIWGGQGSKISYKSYSGKKVSWPKGTYYVKVETSDKLGNGTVGIKVK